MLFEIKPLKPIGTHSFWLANHYLGKDKKDNILISWAREISDVNLFVDGVLIDNSLTKRELRKIHLKIQRGQVKYIASRYLNQAGVVLLHDVFDRLGAFQFSIYDDDKLPSSNVQFIDISDIKENLILSSDITLLVADHHSKPKTMPCYL